MGVVRNRLVAHLLNDAGMPGETASREDGVKKMEGVDCPSLTT